MYHQKYNKCHPRVFSTELDARFEFFKVLFFLRFTIVGTNILYFLVLQSIVGFSLSLLQWMVTQMKSMSSLIFLDMHLMFLFTPSFPSLFSNFSTS